MISIPRREFTVAACAALAWPHRQHDHFGGDGGGEQGVEPREALLRHQRLVPKNLVFANAAASAALDAPSRDALLAASARAEQRGWSASSAAAVQSVEELRRNGMKVERTPPELGKEIRRFSIEWIRQVGPEANDIFVPYFTQG